MSQLVPIPWSTQSTKTQSGVVSCERLVNCYLEANPANSKGPVGIYGDAGLKPWTTVGTAPVRGMLLAGSLLYVVVGVELYSIDVAKTATLIGAILGTGRVSMIANATQIGIATNAGFYYATIGVAATTLVDTSYYTSATYQDGYGILSLSGTEQFFITGLDDFSTVDPLDFTSADTFADNITAVISDHRELLALGANTIEKYYNSGDAAFPFKRTPGGFVETGCKAAGSVAKLSNKVFFLGNDGGVWTLSGGQPQKISTPGVERSIKSFEYPEEARAFTYRVQGHECYGVSFNEGTFVYDLTTGLWRERASLDETRWRGQDYASVFGLDLVSDFETNAIYELDFATHTENGGDMIRLMQSAPLHGNGRRMLMPELYIDCEAGGIAGAGVLDPQWMLQWSDGGKTWSTERAQSAGMTGDYLRRIKWTRMGSFYQRTIRLSISDAAPVVVVGAYARLEACES